MVNVELVYVSKPESHRQYLLIREVAEGTTVQQAIERSGLLDLCPEIPWPDCKVGIFGRHVTLSTKVKEGDRIEIYRPLLNKGKLLNMIAAKTR